MNAGNWVTIAVALIGLAGTIITVVWGNKKIVHDKFKMENKDISFSE